LIRRLLVVGGLLIYGGRLLKRLLLLLLGLGSGIDVPLVRSDTFYLFATGS
jgi:hypothetical protein